jgi:hypothetical protein
MTLRPLGFSELFDAIMNAAFKSFWTFARIVLVVAIPARVTEVVILTLTVSDANDITSRSAFSSQAGSPTNGAVGVGVTVGLLNALVIVIGTAVCFKAAAAAYAGTRASWRSSIQFAAPRIGPVIWVAIVGGLGVVLGLIALIVPGIWLAVSWSVAISALLFESLGPTRALGRSFELVRGRWWPTLATLFVALVVASIASGIVQSGFDALMKTSLGDHVFTAAVLDALGGTLGSVVAVPIQAIAVAMLYLDLRARKERLDTYTLARRLDIEPGAVTTPRAAAPAPGPPSRTPAGAPQEQEGGEGWAPPDPAADVAPPSNWAPPRPPGVEERDS